MSDIGPRRYRLADYAVPPRPPEARWPIRRVLRTGLQVACWLYVASVLALYGIVLWSSPESWMPHLFFYCPRWMVSVPTLLLVPLAIRMQLRREVMALAVAAITFFFGIWGFNVPYRNLVPDDPPARARLRLLTCNVQAGDLKIEEFADLIRETYPDIVLLQEYGKRDPRELLGHEGWSVRTVGEFCVASRHPIETFETLNRPDEPWRTIAVRANVSWFGRTLPIVSVHLMTPREGLEGILNKNWQGIDAFREIAAVQRFESLLVRGWVAESPGSILLAGDFNLTSEHPLFRRDWSTYTDAFSRTGWGLGYTMLTRRFGMRIDHILSGTGWRPVRCWVVDTDVGSEHRAVVADLVEAGPGDGSFEP